MMRTESNLARGIFPQLHVALHGLTWKLLSLYYEIEAIKLELEVRYVIAPLVYHVIDYLSQLQVDKQLLRVNNIGNVSRTPVLSPADGNQSLFMFPGCLLTMVHSWFPQTLLPP